MLLPRKPHQAHPKGVPLYRLSPRAPQLDPSSISSLRECSPDQVPADQQKYTKLLGSPHYMSTRTRPDISTAVSFLAHFTANSSMAHWVAIKRILCYLAGTIHYALMYDSTSCAENDTDGRNGNNNCALTVWFDSDWPCTATDRKSISSWIVQYCVIP